jgi:hypothetical protein
MIYNKQTRQTIQSESIFTPTSAAHFHSAQQSLLSETFLHDLQEQFQFMLSWFRDYLEVIFLLLQRSAHAIQARSGSSASNKPCMNLFFLIFAKIVFHFD